MFPTAVSPAYAYDPDAGYVVRDTLVPGVGYWVKFGELKVVGLIGQLRLADTVEVVNGWNLVGALSDTIAAGLVTSEPPGIIESAFYDFRVGYLKTSMLEPMRGYWVKTSAAGSLIFQSPSSFTSSSARRRAQ
jgi:hypothetical protein